MNPQGSASGPCNNYLQAEEQPRLTTESLQRLPESPNAPSGPNVSYSNFNGMDLSLNLGLLTSATVNPITNIASGVLVHQDNNLVHLRAKRNSPENDSGEYQVGSESSNMGEQGGRVKRHATESDESTDNNIENLSAPAPVMPQMYQFFSETPGSEPIRHDNDADFVLAQRSPLSEPVQTLSGYGDINDRVQNARAILYQSLREQARPSSLRPLQGSQGINYFGAANSSRTHNYHNQVQISRSGIPPYISYEPSLPIPQIPSGEARRTFPDDVHYILQILRRGRPLIFLMRNSNPSVAPPPIRGLSVETIMEQMESETFACDDKEDPEEGEKCPICLEEFGDGDEIGKLHLCAHKFHADCIKQWLEESNVCPVCKRKALNTNNVQNEAGPGAGAGAGPSEVNT
ncbi:hypothetical protein VNO78_26654 [Psophocarpus tetragonolobus]|uniref:RING-type E3 ubiquitin transferase n=1 Tax=Psophocarpus tetragonolobus TaxID=3891 RepID=A0AAN9X968_PSOTE